MQTIHSSLPITACALLATLWASPLAAQNLPPNQAQALARDPTLPLPAQTREHLETIGGYAAAVNRKLERHELDPPPADESRLHRFEQLVDPFSVSPQLRQGKTSQTPYGGLPGAGRLELQQQIQLKAVVIMAKRRAAQLNVRGKDITVLDGELVDLSDLGTFEIRIDRESVTLSNPSAPQGAKLILR